MVNKQCEFVLMRIRNVTNLIIGSVILIIVTGIIAYNTEKKNNPELSVSEFLSFSPFPSLKSIMTGMTSGLVFGFIDNAGLWFGMDALDPYLPGGALTKAGYGNTFSDFLGSFLGTFAGIIIKNVTGITDTPLWSDTIGVVIGCLLGIFIPAAITGKQ